MVIHDCRLELRCLFQNLRIMKLHSITASYTTATLYLPTTILPDLDSKKFAAFFKERCDDHGGFLWPDASNTTQPHIHLSLVVIQYLQPNCA